MIIVGKLLLLLGLVVLANPALAYLETQGSIFIAASDVVVLESRTVNFDSQNSLLINTEPGDLVLDGGVITTITGEQESLYHVAVDGNLYMDYTVFNDGTSDAIGSGGYLSFSAQNFSLLGFEMTPPIPDLSNLTILPTLDLVIDHAGDLLLFSDSPVNSAIFEVTGDIVIGNYSSMAPVPLPGSVLLLVSALMTFVPLRFFRRG